MNFISEVFDIKGYIGFIGYVICNVTSIKLLNEDSL